MATKTPALSESHPDIADRWVGNVNAKDVRTPDDFSVKARLECWWWCRNEGHAWFAAQPGEHRIGFTCPQCSEERWAAFNRLLGQPVEAVPELVAAWRDERSYYGLTVGDLCLGVAGAHFGMGYSLRCPEGHKIDTVVRSFVGIGCPWCRGNKTREEPHRSIAEADPELAATFHPARNGDLTAENTLDNYRKPLWWKSAQCCGYEWQETINERQLGRRPQAGRGHYYCPRCESVWGSLAWLDPELATEWHEDNDLTPWHVKPFSAGVVAKWRCSANPEHVWEAEVISRSAGRLCPQCSMAGTSKIEQAFLAAAQEYDPEAAAGRVGRWRVDVLVPSAWLIIEYDGVYWHGGKQETDLRKSRALIEGGYRVARIRENELPHLAYADPRFLQVTFWPAFGDVGATTRELIEWARP